MNSVDLSVGSGEHLAKPHNRVIKDRKKQRAYDRRQQNQSTRQLRLSDEGREESRRVMQLYLAAKGQKFSYIV